MNLQDLPYSDRPRERLLRYGAESLSSLELLAILLSSGNGQRGVLEIAADLLEQFPSLDALSDASFEELSKVQGIGEAKATLLQAAFSLGKRLEKKEGELLFIKDIEKISERLRRDFPAKQEAVMVLLCDVKRAIFHREIVALGTLTQVLLHPREVFHPAIRKKAHSILLAHNHPSGDPTPSVNDIELTRSLAAAGETLGISLLDHLIVGAKSYFSFQEKGLL